MWMTSCTGSVRRILGDLKKSVSWVEFLARKKTVGWLSLARRSQASGLAAGITRDLGRWKSQNRKNVYLSPYVEEPLNSKVIKSFVPELRSRYVFFVFQDSYVLCIYVMNILCTFPIFMYGYGTICRQIWIPRWTEILLTQANNGYSKYNKLILMKDSCLNTQYIMSYTF